MNVTFGTFAGLVCFWLALCCFCGLKGRYLLFLALLFFALAVHSIWLSAALKVPPLDSNALMAQGAGTICAVGAFALGRFMGRIQDAFRESRIEDTGV